MKESTSEAKETKSSSPEAELGRMAPGRSVDSDIILNETMKILADYADLLGGQHKNLAGSGKSAAVL
ncbi:MAG TPA: hypothetical protein VIM14_10725 [Polyangia bacterium]